MTYEITANDPLSNARCGIITTDHGTIQTPIFMPVGTAGTVKAMTMEQMEATEAQIILGNSYHLYLRPGLDILRAAGGLHRFGTWKKPILTDSGGFQVFSLAERRKITREGVTFASHIDGSRHLFTPERVMDIERTIGADIMMAFDECPSGTASYNYAKESLELTLHWLDRCEHHFNQTEPLYGYTQALFPIVQGCVYPDLRRKAAETVAAYDAPGNAIGGLAVGEPTEQMYEMIEVVNDILPKDRPRYLMGVGTPANLLEGVARGVDMFDCIMPTRNARNAQLFTNNGIINIRNSKWKDCFEPIERNGASPIDERYSLAYLHHLFRAEEITALTLASIHNVAFYTHLMSVVRSKIADGTFSSWKDAAAKRLMQRL